MPEDRDYKVTDRRGGTDEPAPEKAPPGAETAAPAPEREEPAPAAASLPDVDFATFVLSLASSAVAHLHGLDDNGEQTLPPNLPLAQQSIDILSMLQAKTKGNLTGEEERLVDHVLFDLRMRFVEAARGKK